VVGVDFDVLEGDVLLEKHQKHALHEGAELGSLEEWWEILGRELNRYPAGVKLQGSFLLMLLHHLRCCSGGMRE
jgi:hypothetical protein